jgi:hypothetical protein
MIDSSGATRSDAFVEAISGRTSSSVLASSRVRLALLLTPLLVAIFSQPLRALTDSDYWWHVRTGQMIFETGAVPRVDPYSHTMGGQPWVTHEWLTELLMYLVERDLGYVGNAVVFGLIGAITWLAVYATCRRWGVGEVGAAILMMWGQAMAIPSIGVRPQMLTALFLATYVLLITLYLQGHRRALWPLPVLMIVWVNLHGGYVIGLVLLGLTMVGAALGRRFGQPAPDIRPLMVIGVLTGAGTLVNPHGLEALAYPFSYAGASNASMRFVAEWQSPNFHDPSFLIFAASLLLGVAIGVRRHPAGPVAVIWTVVFALMALQSIRHIALYAVVVMPLLGARLQAEVPGVGQPLSEWRRPGLLALASPLILAVILAGLVLQDQRQGLQLGWEPRSTGYPAGAVAYLRENNPPGNLFNDYDFGGYLIRELYPERLVFIDGRVDVYGDGFANYYHAVTLMLPGWRQALDDHQVGVIVVRKETPMARVLSEDSGWQETFKGDVERLFVRRAK